MEQEAIRKIDELGRIVIPSEMRSALCWDEKTKILIVRLGKQLILQTSQNRCCLCGSEEKLKPIYEKFICQKCIDEINK